MELAHVYLTLSIVACLIAWLSSDHVIQKVSLLLLGSCAISNVFNELHVQPPTLQLLNGGLDLAVLCGAFLIWKKTRHSLIIPICMCLVAMLSLHALTAPNGGNKYYYQLFLNLLFLAQLVCVGGYGVGNIVGGIMHRVNDSILRRRSAHFREHR